MKNTNNEYDYLEILEQCKTEIYTAKNNIAIKINQSVISVYWNLGKLLFEKVLENTHGSGIVKKLSNDLKSTFPDLGLSPRNLWDMKRFYDRFKDSNEKLRHAVAVLPWGHILLLMSKANSDDEINYYAKKCIENSWKRSLLLNQIKANNYLLNKDKNISNNFSITLPENTAEYANELIKNKYNLGFLGITENIKERELEKRLVSKIKNFILELGKGFTFIGNQYALEYNEKEYFVDLLFYHRDLRALIAIELKIGEFIPEYVGKMNFYLSLLDKYEKKQGENNSIGIILCADKNNLDVEIALQDINKPIGVAEYELLLPKVELQKLINSELKRKLK